MDYYKDMMTKDRLIPIVKGNVLIGIITYYIGSSDNIDKYVRDDPWTVLDDEPTTGDICFIDQLIGDKEYKNFKESFKIFSMVCDHIQSKYPQVQLIRWNRVKKGEVYVRTKSLRR
jgi:hypothetical protein